MIRWKIHKRFNKTKAKTAAGHYLDIKGWIQAVKAIYKKERAGKNLPEHIIKEAEEADFKCISDRLEILDAVEVTEIKRKL